MTRDSQRHHSHALDRLDHVNVILEDLKSLVVLCDELLQDYDRLLDNQMNETLNMLTLITAVFIPMQTLTGMYVSLES